MGDAAGGDGDALYATAKLSSSKHKHTIIARERKAGALCFRLPRTPFPTPCPTVPQDSYANLRSTGNLADRLHKITSYYDFNPITKGDHGNSDVIKRHFGMRRGPRHTCNARTYVRFPKCFLETPGISEYVSIDWRIVERGCSVFYCGIFESGNSATFS